MRRLLTPLALLLIASSAAAQEATPPMESLDLDRKDTKNMRGATTVIVPTLYINYSVEGSLFVAAQGRGSAQAKAEFVVSNFDREFAQQVTANVQADLVRRLRDAGFTVLTHEDVADHAEVAGHKMLRPHRDFGMPSKEFMNVKYIIATPSEATSFDPAMTGYPVWGFRRLARERDAHILVPEYWFSAPQMWGETGRGTNSVRAGVNVAPGITMSNGRVAFMNPRASGGTLILKKWVATGDNVGQLVQTEENRSSLPGFSGFGAGSIGRSKGSYVLELDRAAFEAAVLRGAGAFNEQIVAAYVAERGR
ncbi:MAG TPA: hypothetical protein VK928_07755 [Longimicrobiales bacterium]|nr:hypothetical protein [Longimicrobiales bacterium]